MDVDSHINAELTKLMTESGDTDGDGVSDNLQIALKFVRKCAEFLEDRLAGCQLAFPADDQVMHVCEFETCPCRLFRPCRLAGVSPTPSFWF